MTWRGGTYLVSSKPSTDIFLEEDEQHKAPVECCGHVYRADLSIQGLLLGYEGLWAPGARRWQLVQHKVILNKCFLNSRVNWECTQARLPGSSTAGGAVIVALCHPGLDQHP